MRTPISIVEDQEFMRRALELAAMARGDTSPNPMVGAVVVRKGEIVGEGYHHRAGEPHAEVHALAAAGEKSHGATIYVTLEPCCFTGRTPPCTDAVLASGVIRCVAAMKDPNPRVAGQGLERIRAGGIAVTVGVEEEASRELNAPYIKWVETGLPLVTLKVAMTLDGKIATHTGDAKWITSEAARKRVHQWRHEHDAVLVGVRTVECDNPMLNCRLQDSTKQPWRVILDRQGRLPHDCLLVTTAPDYPTLWVTASPHPEFESTGLQNLVVPTVGERFDLNVLLKELGQRNILSVLVEGGSRTLTAFWEERCFERWISVIAPKLIGGQAAPTPLGGTGAARMKEALKLQRVKIEVLGEEVIVEGRRQ